MLSFVVRHSVMLLETSLEVDVRVLIRRDIKMAETWAAMHSEVLFLILGVTDDLDLRVMSSGISQVLTSASIGPISDLVLNTIFFLHCFHWDAISLRRAVLIEHSIIVVRRRRDMWLSSC